jgi:hypothetical protein
VEPLTARPLPGRPSGGLKVALLLLTLLSPGCGSSHPAGGGSGASDGGPETGRIDAAIRGSGDSGAGSGSDGDSSGGGHADAGQDGGASCKPGSAIWPSCADAKACSFYVAPSGGGDSNIGSSSAPFASLERLQAALSAASSSSKVGCLMAGAGGTYDRTATLTLTSADDGESWQFDPAGNVDTAVLDGGHDTDLIVISDGSNITINGLVIQNFNGYGVNGSGSGDKIENCDLGFNTVTSWQSAAITFGGTSPDTILRNNYVHDVGSQGIALFDGYSTPGDINGSVIENNVVLRAVQRMYDGGGIYVSMHGGCFVSQACAVTVRNNFVRDQGSASISGPYGDSVNGIYLDDNASNVTVTGNVIGPPNEGSINASNDNNCTGFEVHNGSHNTISGNIVDLGSSGMVSTANWSLDSASIAGMSNNMFTNNIAIYGFTGDQETSSSGIAGYSYFNPAPASWTAIDDNMYFNYAGGNVRTDGDNASDSNPTIEDPEVSGWTYQLAAGSAAFGAPVKFPPIVGGWGPPGFAVPESGTPPSSPH